MEQGEGGSALRIPKHKLRGTFIPRTREAYQLPQKNIFNKIIRWTPCPLTNYFGTQVSK